MPRIVPSIETSPRDSLRYLLCAAIVIAALSFGAELLEPAALAILLSFVLAPGVRWLQRWRLGRVLPVLVMAGLAFLVILAFGGLMAVQLRDLADSMPRYQSTVVEKIETLRGMLSGGGMSRFSDFVSGLAQHLGSAAAPAVGAAGSSAGGAAEQPVPVVISRPAELPLETFGRYLTPVLHPLAVAGLVGIYAVFILIGREDLRNRAIRLFGAGDLHRSTAAMDDAVRRLSTYLVSQFAVNAASGAVIGLGLAAIGLPSAVLWGILFGCLRFVPYVGPPIAALAPIALAGAVSPGWSMVIETAALYLAVESIVGQVVEPLIYGHNTGLSPLAVVIAATFWTVLWGPIGLVLSTPLTVCLVVLGRHVEALAFLDIMLGDQPALAPHEIFYQRMLADDAVDASDHAEQQLNDIGLVEFYDDVMVPGLRLAQADIAQGRLDLDRQRRIAAVAGEIVENLSEVADAHRRDGGPRPSLMARITGGARDGGEPAPDLEDQDADAALPEAWTRSNAILCIGARGPLDDAVALALAQLLARSGFGVRTASYDMISKARISEVDLDEAKLVVLSCLDGTNAAYLRFALRRLHRRNAAVPVLVGAWWRDGADPREEADPVEPDAAQGDDRVVTLSDAVGYVTRLSVGPKVPDEARRLSETGRPRDAVSSR